MKNKQNKDIKSDCELVFQKVSEKLKKLSGSTLLITGGTGFLGSWVSELVFYMNENHKMNVRLYLVDRDFEDFKSNLPHLVESENIKFIRSDIRHLTEIPSEVNYIIHAANNPDNRFHSSRPLESMTTVAEGIGAVVKSASLTQNLLKIVNISSSSVYSMGKDCDKNFIIAYSKHTTVEFPAIINKDNIYGIQFHPEKSHTNGMDLLKKILNDSN